MAGGGGDGGSGTVFRETGPWPAELAPLAGALGAARQASGRPLVVVGFESGEEARRKLAKRRHDVKAALRTLGFTVKALAGGYRFDDGDEKAKAKIDAIAKAVDVLEREALLLTEVLDPGEANP